MRRCGPASDAGREAIDRLAGRLPETLAEWKKRFGPRPASDRACRSEVVMVVLGCVAQPTTLSAADQVILGRLPLLHRGRLPKVGAAWSESGRSNDLECLANSGVGRFRQEHRGHLVGPGRQHGTEPVRGWKAR